MISLSDPVLGEEEKETLCSVISSGWITMGERTVAFERAFAEVHKVERAVAVNSCTAGLHLCLATFGLGPGDEVLVPSLTFVATVNAVLYVGAKPVFVDIETSDRPHISLYDAAEKYTSRTRAVIVMHYGGYLVDLPAWRSFADAHGLKLIEDSAHATATGQVGQLSDAACFSFFSNKNMTTAEGGMVVSRNGSMLERIRRMRSHGMTTSTLERQKGHAYSYDVTMLGYNYRIDELRAALGLVQLARLPEWNRRRRILTDCYRAELERQLPKVSVPFDKSHETAAHLMPVLLPEGVDREKAMIRLHQEDIQSSIHYPPVHQVSYYLKRFPGVSLPNTEQFAARELTLPLHPGLHERDVERVIHVLSECISDNV